jgi:hypothetical protein
MGLGRLAKKYPVLLMPEKSPTLKSGEGILV